MNRFPALAALAFALSTLCACDPSQMLPGSSQLAGQASPHQGYDASQARPHQAKPADQSWAQPGANNCSVYPGNDKLCSPVPEPSDKVAPAQAQAQPHAGHHAGQAQPHAAKPPYQLGPACDLDHC